MNDDVTILLVPNVFDTNSMYFFDCILVDIYIYSNPFDVLKTLSQTNQGKSIPLATLVGQMYSDQGWKGFYRGVQVNIMRACVLNATKMGVYDIAKGKVVDATGWTRKDPRTAFLSSFVAGFFMTCTVVRTGWMVVVCLLFVVVVTETNKQRIVHGGVV